MIDFTKLSLDQLLLLVGQEPKAVIEMERRLKAAAFIFKVLLQGDAEEEALSPSAKRLVSGALNTMQGEAR